MLVPMWIVYAVMLFGYILGTLRALQVLVTLIKSRRNP